MKTSRTAVSILLVIVVLLVQLLPVGSRHQTAQGKANLQASFTFSPVQPSQPSNSGDSLFIENAGQLDPRARFQLWGAQGTVFLADDGIWLTLVEKPSTPQSPSRAVAGELDPLLSPVPDYLTVEEAQPIKGVNLHLSYTGANPQPRVEGINRQDTAVSYFVGNNPDQWHPDVPVWGGVRYVDIYPGVDLEVTGEKGSLGQRFVVRKQRAGLAALREARLKVDGADGLSVDDNGLLNLTTAVGPLAVKLAKLEVGFPAGAMALSTAVSGITQWTMRQTPSVLGFEVMSPFDQVQDTTGLSSSVPDLAPRSGPHYLHFSTLLGGSGEDKGTSIALDPAGNTYISGSTKSTNFPASAGAYDTTFVGLTCSLGSSTFPCPDAFVAKFNPAGGLIYATLLGAENYDYGYGVAVSSAGEAYVAGYTTSADFPVTPGAIGSTMNGAGDAFLTKLAPSGNSLVFSTFLGGSSTESLSGGIALDSAGNVYVTGSTYSSDFPSTPGSYRTPLSNSTCSSGSSTPSCPDAFVAKLDPTGNTLIYAALLGGSNVDQGGAIAVDEAGNAFVTGETRSSDFPITAGAVKVTFGGGNCGTFGSYICPDAFVVKLSPTGDSVIFATFLGGVGEDRGYSIALDAERNAYLTGWAGSLDFPTTPGAYDRTQYGNSCSIGLCPDAFAAKLSPSGDYLVYSTFLGGNNYDYGLGIKPDRAGNAYVVGLTQSRNFPTTPDGLKTDFGWDSAPDAFVVELDPSGSTLLYATFLGGSDSDYSSGLAIDATGSIYFTGAGASGFPTTPGVLQGTAGGGGDVFITKLSTDPPPTPDFTLAVSPNGQAIEPGETAAFTLTVQPLNGFTNTVTLSLPSAPPSTTLSLSPLSLAPSQVATLIITDTHAGPLVPGIAHTTAITATGSGLTRTVSVPVVVGGSRLFLPLTSRNY